MDDQHTEEDVVHRLAPPPLDGGRAIQERLNLVILDGGRALQERLNYLVIRAMLEHHRAHIQHHWERQLTTWEPWIGEEDDTDPD